MDSPLQSILLAELPGWDDDILAAPRFKALTGQRSDWDARFLFWKDAIIKVARRLNLLVIDAHAVRHHWFLRGGLVPLCINQVLVEMCKCGDLEKVDKQQETLWRFNWLWPHIRIGGFWATGNMLRTPANGDSIEGRLIVTTLLHERLEEITKSISDNCWTTSCVATMSHFIRLCGGEEEANILKSELLRSRRGKYFVTDGSNRIEGLKLSPTPDRVSDISKLDCYMLHLYWTLEKIQIHMDVLEKALNKSKKQAIKALQEKDKRSAKHHVRSMRILTESKLKCNNSEGKIQEIVSLISQAEMTKQVSEAIKVGTDALKEHMVPLEDIQACLHELDETILLHKETANALGSSMEGDEGDDLDLELAELDLEVLHEKSQNPVVKVENITGDDNHEQPSASQILSTKLEEVENVMTGLTLECEPA